MGYELVIRPRSTGKSLVAQALVARLQSASEQGIGAVVEAARAAPPPSAPGDEAPAGRDDSARLSPPPSSPSPEPTSEASDPAQEGSPPSSWSLSNGQARVGARLFRRDDAVQGADFDIPFGGTEEEFRRVVGFLLGAAEGVDGIVFDPQLGRELVGASADQVVARWREAQIWAADVVGNAEDPRGVLEYQPHPPAVSPRAKALLLVIGGFLAVYWLLSALLGATPELK